MGKAVPYLLVGAGGFLGAIARLVVSRIFVNHGGRFPLGTFVVNISGCFFLGMLGYAAFHAKNINPDYLRYTLGIGFLGAYTTFSTFEFETMVLMEQKAFLIALSYVAVSVIAGFAAVRFGMAAADYMAKIL